MKTQQIYIIVSEEPKSKDLLVWGNPEGNGFSPFRNVSPVELNEQLRACGARSPAGLAMAMVGAGNPLIVPIETSVALKGKICYANGNSYCAVAKEYRAALDACMKNAIEVKL